jgi:hypothetical protein
MFVNGLRLRGSGASILWGSNAIPAAVLAKWAITKGKQPADEWTLAAVLGPGGVDAFKIRQSRLYFTAPRLGGFWMWPVRAGTVQIGTAEIRARLGPPEQ